MTKTLPPFHLAFPVHDLAEARAFYGGVLGCEEGRSSDQWIDFNFFGHQIVTHLDEAMTLRRHSNPVDGHDVPVPHFGAVLPMAEWESLARKLEESGLSFVIAPTVRFRGQAGEQATMFFLDPSGNAMELKAMRDPSNLFAKQ
jgi:extradiol dioxygenase family protein